LHSARASNNLGVLYFHNKKMDAANPNSKVTNESNVQNNLEKAKQYLEEAEVQGFSQAFFNLGCIYEQGLIGKKDEEKALKYFYNGGLKGDIQSKLKFSYHIMKQTCIMKE
jgi:TPR repeat protein